MSFCILAFSPLYSTISDRGFFCWIRFEAAPFLGSDYKKPDAITVISKDNFKQIAWPLPASDLLYVGRATEKKLTSLGIHTIGDLAGTSNEVLRSFFGKWGDVLYCFSNGLDTTPASKFDNQPTIKSIGNSTTTPRDLENNEDVKIILYALADSVTRRLREQGFKARTVCISVRCYNGI